MKYVIELPKLDEAGGTGVLYVSYRSGKRVLTNYAENAERFVPSAEGEEKRIKAAMRGLKQLGATLCPALHLPE